MAHLDFREEEYATIPIAFVCSSPPLTNNLHSRYYFLENQNDETNHLNLPSKHDPNISHAVCLVKRSEREGKYNEGVTVNMKVKMLRLNSLLLHNENDGNLTRKYFFDFCGKQTVLEYDRYDYVFKQALINGHPSTRNGTLKVFDYYCGYYAQRFTIELDQKDIERSKLEVTPILPIFSNNDHFTHLNYLIPTPFIKHDMFLMFEEHHRDTLQIEPTFLKQAPNDSSKLIKEVVNISPMPFAHCFLIHSNILSRLNQSSSSEENNYLIISYEDRKSKKNHHLIRKLTFEVMDDGKTNGKLARSDFKNFYKHFSDKMKIIGHCRLNDTCFLYKLCTPSIESRLKFDNIQEFSQQTKWILIDLEDLSVQEIHPYSMKLLPSLEKPSFEPENQVVDEDGFITQHKEE
ncbi:predicted protein [Naegleria gruberi]|uniref:Predicted protein n=1 Tax=Naegleria gruberi TaxID=5762 RepID=D2V5G5_NAEGR|nr:uncharacterized protein NAEGRDRAFT_63814 [Naegleria gruberi]EFC48111.1 predicted protein [Naegleria gruberi]|eukprot:XP_002680855.1 predicted protein [Naegleria gruberi strain NEG-M]